MARDLHRLISESSGEFDFGVSLPRRRDLRIALVGAGAIVNSAHLPAYAQAGFTVVGVLDIHQDRAEATAQRFGIERTYRDLEELLSDPAVEIVDIAVTPTAQHAIAINAAASGKHLLCQKPLAENFAAAAEIVSAAEVAGVKLAVNQQMRWTPLIACAKRLIEENSLGDPVFAAIRAHLLTDWSEWPWIVAGVRGDLLYHTIHYLDSMRYLFGLPEWVFSAGTRRSDEALQLETATLTILRYASGLHALIDVNHGVWADDRFATLRIEGLTGLIKGTIGLEYDPPHGRVDTIQIKTIDQYPEWTDPHPTGRWLPDAFVGPMASLMRAIEDGKEPATSGRDHLDTLRLVFAGYRSMEERRAVAPSEIEVTQQP
jgi:predicted dehydrogenase